MSNYTKEVKEGLFGKQVIIKKDGRPIKSLEVGQFGEKDTLEAAEEFIQIQKQKGDDKDDSSNPLTGSLF